MASTAQFHDYPPFPEDVPTAALPKISLAKLLANQVDESKALFESCCSIGFFLLDLSGHEIGEALVQDVDSLLELAKQTMALPEDEKMKYHAKPPVRLVGYKSLGFMKTETNQPDRCEFFMLSQDELTGLAPAPEYPPPIRSSLPALNSYLAHAEPIVELICRILSTSLDLPPSTFLSKQSQTSKSGTLLRLIKYPAAASAADRRTSLVPHTAMGTITLLAGVIGGLQILRPSSSRDEGSEEIWEYVKPEPNCLIVNMGDAMVQWTGGVLRSNVHRVTYPPGAQAGCDRYSVAYLIRASGDANMRRLSGGRIPDEEADGLPVDDDMLAGEWERKKSMALVSGKDCVRSTGGRPMKGE
ncbi:Clavaminate synthase-like protein [Byssothecium circinans]|uniref:Clavaminate synthase-like protein n=1 Tax=Byssothecium circinans TaxID=147558 RepID=A0A6A5TWE7_9PLEO|nr:Clavaminate synthase-like protein [Byssothecium circinans]